LVLLVISINTLYAESWVQKSDFGGAESEGTVSFTIYGKGYMGTGNATKTFWQYDPDSNIWTQVADLPGPGRFYAVGFAIGEFGYIGTGNINAGSDLNIDDFWQYNQIANTWSQKATVPGGDRENAFGFSIGSRGYIGGGNNSGNKKEDFWEYDPTTDFWIQKSDYGGGLTSGATAFVISGKGYVGTGRSNTGIYKNDFWQYDPVTDVWIQKANFGGIARSVGISFSLNALGYLGLGYGVDGGQTWFNDFWQYDPVLNTWEQVASYPGLGQLSTCAFSIGGRGYAGLGGDSNYKDHKDFWEYIPDTVTSIKELTSKDCLSFYPNPFKTHALISFSSNVYSRINIEFFASSGKKIKTILDENLKSGKHEIVLDRENLIAGVYFLRIKINDQAITKKIVIE
jgi:N-acetylneuraminic acid mutarotase